MNLTEAYLLLIVLLAIVAVASVFFKSRVTWVTPVIFGACAVVTLVAGMGIRIREITEGPFVYLDTSMQVLCGAAFCFLMYQNGTFQYIFRKIVAKKRGSVLQLLLLVLFIGLPGMITGTIGVSLATTGLMAGKYLLDKGLDKAKVVEVVAVGSVLGSALPPLCLPAMMTTVARYNLYPGSFEGFFLPCLIAALPALIVYCIMASGRILGDVEADAQKEKSGSALCLIPIIVVAVLVICHNFLYTVTPFLGYPLIYTIGFILAVFLKVKGANILLSAADGIRSAAPEVAMICAFAAVIETFAVVGTNGTIAAQLVLVGTPYNLYVLFLLAVTLILGIVLGPCVGLVFGGLSAILSSLATYGASGMPMMALALVVLVSWFAALRGGVVDWTGEALDVSGVSAKSVLAKTWVPMVLMLVTAVIYLVARTACANLMI